MPNPVLPGHYADPELHRFAGRYWIYPTTSAPFEQQTSFEAFVSDDLRRWESVGTILHFQDVPWSTNRAAWAPSAAERDGRYYLYFSAGDGAGIGVAVADRPEGPFEDALGHALVSEYHHGAQPIDAHAFTDDDGQSYLYWGGWRRAVVAKLGHDMVSLDGEVREITPEGYVEGPFMLRRGDRYYYMWSEGNWTDHSYGVAYGTSDSPWGPFRREGVVLKNDLDVGLAAGHHSVIHLPDEDRHVIAYHRRPIGVTDQHHRVTCLDWLEFGPEGEILPVRITQEGVG